MVSQRLIRQNDDGEWETRDTGTDVLKALFQCIGAAPSSLPLLRRMNEAERRGLVRWLEKMLTPPAKLVWTGSGFMYGPKLIEYYLDRWPEADPDDIRDEIENCAAYHVQAGTKMKSPMGRLNTWLTNRYGKHPKWERKPEPAEKAFEPADPDEIDRIMGWS